MTVACKEPELNKPRREVEEFVGVDLKSTLSLSVFPAKAGIQVFPSFLLLIALDAGFRRHDETSLRPKAGDFNDPLMRH